jgi:transposase
MSRRGHSQLPVEERMRVVLAVLSGELTVAEAARRHGTTGKTVAEWRDRFLKGARLGWRT